MRFHVRNEGMEAVWIDRENELRNLRLVNPGSDGVLTGLNKRLRLVMRLTSKIVG